MRRTNCCGIVAACVVLMGSVAVAEQAKPPTPLSLQQVLDLTMKNQTDIITARNNVTIAKGKSSEALAQYLPQLSIQNNAFVWGSGAVLNRSTTGTAFNVSQSVFDGGLREANNIKARYGIKQNSASLSRTVQSVTFTVTKAYYEALRSKHLAEVAEANVKYTEGLRQQIEEQAKLGAAAKVDVLPVEAQLANAKVSQLSAQNAVRTSSLQLQNTMGLSPTPGFDIQDVQEPPEMQMKPIQNYVSNALNARPDVLQTKAGNGAARASLRAARIGLYPRPVISAEYQKEIQGGFTSSSGQMVGGIVFNLFDGGANRAAFKEAQASAANAAQQEQQIVKDIQAQVDEAYLNLNSAKERLAASQVGETAAQANYDAQKDRYNQGLATPLDMLNAEVQLITAQSNTVQARYDYYIAIAQMDYSVGMQGGFNAK